MPFLYLFVLWYLTCYLFDGHNYRHNFVKIFLMETISVQTLFSTKNFQNAYMFQLMQMQNLTNTSEKTTLFLFNENYYFFMELFSFCCHKMTACFVSNRIILFSLLFLYFQFFKNIVQCLFMFKCLTSRKILDFLVDSWIPGFLSFIVGIMDFQDFIPRSCSILAGSAGWHFFKSSVISINKSFSVFQIIVAFFQWWCCSQRAWLRV